LNRRRSGRSRGGRRRGRGLDARRRLRDENRDLGDERSGLRLRLGSRGRGRLGRRLGAGVGEGEALENEVMEEGNTRFRSGLNMLGSGMPSVTVTTTHSVAVSVSTMVRPRSWRTGLATARIALDAARRTEDLILRRYSGRLLLDSWFLVRC